jgi:hypothetical protein
MAEFSARYVGILMLAQVTDPLFALNWLRHVPLRHPRDFCGGIGKPGHYFVFYRRTPELFRVSASGCR